MDILISRAAHDAFGDLLEGVAGDCRWVCVEDDGSTTASAGASAETDAIDIAWLSTDVIYGRSASRFLDLVHASTHLQWLQSSFAGMDAPLVRHSLERGVRVSISHENAVSISEYVIGAVLRRFQSSDAWLAAQHQHVWEHHEFQEICGTTWLIIGMGAIGREVAVRVAAFGAHVIGVRRDPTGEEPVDEIVLSSDLLRVLGRAHVIVLAVPSSVETYHMVNDTFIAELMPGTLLVNVARGSLVDEAAVLVALNDGRLGGAILDVFAEEPLPQGSPIWPHPSITVTPHNSSAGLGRHRRNATLFIRNLSAFMEDRSLANEVSLDDLPEPRACGTETAQFRI